MIASFHLASSVDRLGWVLVHSLWQFSLLMLIALVLQCALHRCSAVARYWALLVMMCTMVIASVATWHLLPADPTVVAVTGVESPLVTAAIERPPANAEQAVAETPQLVAVR